jgi:hypothetical protein
VSAARRGGHVEPIGGALDHRLGRRDRRLTHGRSGFDVHDYRVLQIDQIALAAPGVDQRRICIWDGG